MLVVVIVNKIIMIYVMMVKIAIIVIMMITIINLFQSSTVEVILTKLSSLRLFFKD